MSIHHFGNSQTREAYGATGVFFSQMLLGNRKGFLKIFRSLGRFV